MREIASLEILLQKFYRRNYATTKSSSESPRQPTTQPARTEEINNGTNNILAKITERMHINEGVKTETTITADDNQ